MTKTTQISYHVTADVTTLHDSALLEIADNLNKRKNSIDEDLIIVCEEIIRRGL
jgi:hypothetical protein